MDNPDIAFALRHFAFHHIQPLGIGEHRRFAGIGSNANDQRVDKLRAAKAGVGYKAATGTYEDMFVAGIVDPTKVTRSALQNAASIAAMILTTECLVTDEPVEEKAGAGMPDMGGMGGMM